MFFCQNIPFFEVKVWIYAFNSLSLHKIGVHDDHQDSRISD